MYRQAKGYRLWPVGAMTQVISAATIHDDFIAQSTLAKAAERAPGASARGRRMTAIDQKDPNTSI
jgi:hypothetical protein